MALLAARSRSKTNCVLLIAFVLLAVLQAQAALPLAPVPVPSHESTQSVMLKLALHQLLAHATLVFSGTVLRAQPATFPPSRPGSTTIRLRVDHGLLGVHDADVLDYRTWHTLDAAGIPPGTQVILFLHQPNAAGLTSPSVNGFPPIYVTGGDQVDLRAVLFLARRSTPPASASQAGLLQDTRCAPVIAPSPRLPVDSTQLPAFPCRRLTPGPPAGPIASSLPRQAFLALVQASIAASAPGELTHAP